MKMKYYLKSSLAILLMLASTGMHAQIKSGYIIGLNLSTMTLNTPGVDFETKTSTGIHFGKIFEIPLNTNFALQPGFLFSAKGSIYKIDTAEFSISPIYIEIPVIAVFSFGSDVVKTSLFAGTYFAYGVGGNMESGGELEYINFGSGEKCDMKPFDIGLNFGAGVYFKGLLISAQYGLGLANVSPVRTFDSEMKNKVIGISITTLFTGK
jgi:hypothetical protein